MKYDEYIIKLMLDTDAHVSLLACIYPSPSPAQPIVCVCITNRIIPVTNAKVMNTDQERDYTLSINLKEN